MTLSKLDFHHVKGLKPGSAAGSAAGSAGNTQDGLRSSLWSPSLKREVQRIKETFGNIAG